MELPAYFLTWTTYGTWLHGDNRGSVDDAHAKPGSDFLPADPARLVAMREKLGSPPIVLNGSMRAAVHGAIERIAAKRGWRIHALNARSNHVHVVVSAATHTPEQVMAQFKAWATSDLRARSLVSRQDRVWTKMGSTRWLNDERSCIAAIDYVLRHQ